MALEYLTENSLTAHPFKVRRVLSSSEENQIQTDWFYDILFVSFSDSIRSVFISNITKNEYGDVALTFSNVETSSVIATVTIENGRVQNHYKNLANSFASASSDLFAVKLLFGPGIVNKSGFSQDYTVAEAELSSAAVVLNAPRVTKLTFEAYDADISSEPFEIHSFEYPAVPSVQLKHNAAFVLEELNLGGLNVQRGLGEGLYDNCPPVGNISDVYTINNVSPNDAGALFLNMSNCYTVETLNDNSAVLLGAYSVGGYLYDYHNFEVHNTPTTTNLFDAVSVGHTLVMQNYCKPKCPPENLSAFAYYLNRVTDAAVELDFSVARSIETRGKGEGDDQDPTVFNAVSFCDPADSTFSRCSDPSHTESYIACGSGFIKYFHEARTLQIHYDNLTNRSYTIVEVIDENAVRLDSAPTQTGVPLSFRALDNGVFSNMNCAASAYNTNADTFRNTYFKVKYTTAESFSTEGVYTTYLAVVVAVFNPSADYVTIHVDFTHSSKLTAEGSFKIRTAGDIQILSTADFTLGCQQYAFVEAVYSIGCAETGGALAVEVFRVQAGESTKIGNTYNLENIKGAECPGTVAGNAKVTRVLQSSSASYTDTISLDSGVTSAVLYGAKPDWFLFEPAYTTHDVVLHAASRAAETSSKRYVLYYRSYGGSVAGAITQLVVDYVADPLILAPLAVSYDITSPLAVSTSTIYTDTSPLFQINAANMVQLSADFPSDSALYIYAVTGLPAGLQLDQTTGKVSGQISTSVPQDTAFSISITAANPSGSAVNPQTIYLIVPAQLSPTVYFHTNTPGPSFSTDNVTSYTVAAPLVAFTATNAPIYRYTLTGSLPAGLLFDQTSGKITGKVTSTTLANSNCSVVATNYFGDSTPLTFTIAYAVCYLAPLIFAPVTNDILNVSITAQYTKLEPLVTVTASQAQGEIINYPDCATNVLSNTYTVSVLPPGLVLDSCTGEIYGAIDPASLPPAVQAGASYKKTYFTRICATNPVGRDCVDATINVYSPGVPIISTATSSTILPVERYVEYTSRTSLFGAPPGAKGPLFSIIALNSPTSFEALNLPPGLYCNEAGQIIGTVDPGITAGDYISTLTASNAIGTSEPVSQTFRVLLNLHLKTPPSDNIYYASIGTNYSELVYAISEGIANSSEAVIMTCSALPAGLTFNPPLISGTVGSQVSSGDYLASITVTSNSYGSAHVDFTITVRPPVYDIYGRVNNLNGDAVEGVTVMIDGLYATLSTVEGNYILTGLPSGGYNITAAKEAYTFTPRYVAVNVFSSDVYNANFQAQGPLRLINGRITVNDEPLGGITVSDSTDGYTTVSNSFGLFNLYISPLSGNSITPKSNSYVFDPVSVSLSPSSLPVIDVYFTATSAVFASYPTITSVDSLQTALTVNFTEPAVGGGSDVLNYEYSLNSGTTWNALYPVTTTSPITITGLTGGIGYILKIRAVTAIGPGEASNSWYTTLVNVPATPVIYSVVGGPTQLNVFYTPQSSGGAPISTYDYSLDGGITWLTRTPAREDSPLTVSSLVNGQYYYVAIRAVNRIGYSEASNVVIAAPVSTPTTPAIAGITAANSSLTVYFTPPTDTGGLIITNYAYSVDGGANYAVRNPASLESPINIAGLTNGTTYRVSVAAINSAGRTISNTVTATPATTPSAPTNLTYTVADSKLIIAFQAGASGGSTITDYEYSIESEEHLVYVSSASTKSPITISGLINGDEYHVAIRGVNALGAGEPSIDIVATPMIPPNKPAAPQNLVITNGDYGRLIASFTAPPELAGGTILYYDYSIDNGLTWRTPYPLVLSSPITIDDLIRGTSYTIRVRAVNEAGAGTASTSRTATSVGLPYAPTNLIVTPANNSLIVNFTNALNGGAYITDYSYAMNAPEYDLLYAIGKSNSPVTITGLTNGVSCSLVLYAINSYGFGPASVVVTGTPSTVPDTVTGVTAVYAGTGTLSVAFMEPFNGGSAITDYVYTLNNGITYISANKPSSPFLISGLTNGTAYSIRISAVNSAGRSAAASAAVVATPYGTPLPPTLSAVVTSPTGGCLSIPFTPNTNTGGLPIASYKYSINGSATLGDYLATSSPARICGLLNGVAYTVSFFARNTAGLVSTASNVVTGTPVASLPGAVRLLQASPFDGQLRITCSDPSDRGGDSLLSYEYAVTGGDYNGSIHVVGSTTTATSTAFTIIGLVNGVTYSVAVRAINSAGAGPNTSVSGMPRALAHAPTNLSVTPFYGDSTKVTLAFNPPAETGGYPITNYLYSLNGGNYVSAAKSTNPIQIIGLQRPTVYTIALAAVTSLGTGSRSDTITFTAVSLPRTPTLVSLSGANDMLTASLTIPEDAFVSGDYLEITGFRYSVDGGVSFKEIARPRPSSSQLAITSGLIAGIDSLLVENVSYTVVVQSVNADGVSQSSNSLSAEIGRVPATLTNLTVTNFSPGVVSGYFDTPDPGSSSITEYKYSLVSATGPWTTLSDYNSNAFGDKINFSVYQTLLDDVSYTIYMRALSIIGTSPVSSTHAGLAGPLKEPVPYVTIPYVASAIPGVGTRYQYYIKPVLTLSVSDLTLKQGSIPYFIKVRFKFLYRSDIDDPLVYGMALHDDREWYEKTFIQTLTPVNIAGELVQRYIYFGEPYNDIGRHFDVFCDTQYIVAFAVQNGFGWSANPNTTNTPSAWRSIVKLDKVSCH